MNLNYYVNYVKSRNKHGSFLERTHEIRMEVVEPLVTIMVKDKKKSDVG